jgi:hypothetical protein
MVSNGKYYYLLYVYVKDKPMNQLLCHAIHAKKLISLTYNGISHVVEPHVYGLCSKGEELLRCYQVEGDRISNQLNDWNLLIVSNIEKLTMLENGFISARPGYVKNDEEISFVYDQL